MKITDIEYEILVVDDASNNYFENSNIKAAELVRARFVILKENIGRAAIRNYLGKEAKYENLLFLDCDSIITENDFISKYLNYLNKGTVVYGGTKYQSGKPEKKFRLHWNYGHKREIKPVKVRNEFPSRFFKTNNFLIPKSVLEKLPFNEHLKGYGHEDTLMGVELYQNNIPVFHIDNAVMHAGLETNEQFISKTEESIKNLVFITKNFTINDLTSHFKLLKVFSKVENWNLVGFLRFSFWLTKPLLLFLITRFYWMKALDFYKLGYLCKVYKMQ